MLRVDVYWTFTKGQNYRNVLVILMGYKLPNYVGNSYTYNVMRHDQDLVAQS